MTMETNQTIESKIEDLSLQIKETKALFESIIAALNTRNSTDVSKETQPNEISSTMTGGVQTSSGIGH